MERHGSPAPVTVTAQASQHQRPVFLKSDLVALGPYALFYLCAPRPSISLMLDLIVYHPRLRVHHPHKLHRQHHDIYREADHPPTCVYHLLSFVICQLGSHNIALSQYFFFPDDALNPPSSSPPPYPHHHCVNLRPSFLPFFQTPPAVHYYLSTTGDRTKLLTEHVKHVYNASNSQRNSDPSPSHTHQHHCECCFDYDPIKCCSIVVIALFAYVIVSHDNSTVTSK